MGAYKVIIETPQELNHSSNVQTALFELDALGYVAVDVVLRCKQRRGRVKVTEDGNLIRTTQAYPKASFYTLIDTETNTKIKFSCDLYDFDNEFSEEALETCHWVFKRSYNPKNIAVLSAEYQRKLKPFGLNFGVRSSFHKGRHLLFFGLFLNEWFLYIRPNRSIFQHILKRSQRQWLHWKFVNTTRGLLCFEEHFPLEGDTVFFQTRCFEGNHDDVRLLHEQRYEIIRCLQEAFPRQFEGGFVPCDIARRLYPDALSKVPSEPHAYLEAMKHASIVIYTRGLAQSPAWKLAEYLSQGKVIIAERLTTELPVPLEEGVHLLYFDTLEGLVLQIQKVLSDTDLSVRLSRNARLYFETNVHPVSNMRRILKHMIDNSLR